CRDQFETVGGEARAFPDHAAEHIASRVGVGVSDLLPANVLNALDRAVLPGHPIQIHLAGDRGTDNDQVDALLLGCKDRADAGFSELDVVRKRSAHGVAAALAGHDAVDGYACLPE